MRVLFVVVLPGSRRAGASAVLPGCMNHHLAAPAATSPHLVPLTHRALHVLTVMYSLCLVLRVGRFTCRISLFSLHLVSIASSPLQCSGIAWARSHHLAIVPLSLRVSTLRFASLRSRLSTVLHTLAIRQRLACGCSSMCCIAACFAADSSGLRWLGRCLVYWTACIALCSRSDAQYWSFSLARAIIAVCGVTLCVSTRYLTPSQTGANSGRGRFCDARTNVCM